MPRPPWPLVRALSHAGLVGATDADLLARFAADRDPAAFELLVWRHGRMVLAVCRRVLGDPHRADDAFQATFLILARKAGSVRGSASGYLHRVARRVAVRAAQRDARRRETSLTVDPFAREDDGADPLLRAVLDEEIDRLPDRLRLPVVLCYLDGRPTEEAAALLGVPRGTVLSRLSAARAKLAGRLTRRGVAAPAAGLTATLGAGGPALSGATVTTTLSAVGQPSGAAGPAFLLAREVMRAALWQKLTAATMAAVLVGGTGVGVVRLTGGSGGGVAQAATDPPAKPPEAKPPEAKPASPPTETVAERLAKRLAQIDEEIAVRTALKLQSGAGGEVDPKSLAEAIARLDQRILDQEDQIDRTRRQRDAAATKYEAAKKPSTPQHLDKLAESLDIVRQSKERLAQAEKNVADARGQHGPDSKDATNAELHRAAAAESLDRVRANARADAVKPFAPAVEWAREALAELDRAVDAGEQSRKFLYVKRQQLVERLARVRHDTQQSQRIDDQLQVLRDIRQQLYRRQLLAEFGMADLPAGPPPATGGADRIDQLARDVADLKASLRTADGQDKLDALRQAVDALAAQVRANSGRSR